MAIKPRKQISLAQNFLKSSKLVKTLVASSSIGPSDIAYEIGPGNGIITAQLAQIAKKVIAVEKDIQLVKQLREKFYNLENVKIIERDFLGYRITDKDYKIFANIPYNITADIMRKLLYQFPVPQEAYLVMQKEAAEKFAGFPRETQFSILAKPIFELNITHRFRRTDFQPVPNVDSVLLHIKKREPMLVLKKDYPQYRSFVRFGFGAWKRSLKVSFKNVFTYQQWKRLSNDLHFPLDATPTQLTFEQWLGLFECFQKRTPKYKQMCIKR